MASILVPVFLGVGIFTLTLVRAILRESHYLTPGNCGWTAVPTIPVTNLSIVARVTKPIAYRLDKREDR